MINITIIGTYLQTDEINFIDAMHCQLCKEVNIAKAHCIKANYNSLNKSNLSSCHS